MKQMQLVSSGTISRLRMEAEAAWQRRDLPLCIQILERMNRLSPADVGVLIQLGYMHGLLFDYTKAEVYFERAVQLAPPDRKAEALAEAGQQARDFSDPRFAITYMTRATEAPGATPEMLVRLAEIHDRNRRVAEANAVLDQALSRNPACAPALLLRARLQQRGGKTEEAEKTLGSILRQNLAPENRVRALYELATVLDGQGRYEEAMQTVLQAKALLQPQGNRFLPLRRAIRERMKQFQQNLTPRIVERWSEMGKELQPERRISLLGGHPRSGTTLLEQVLDSHANIVSVEETFLYQDFVAMPLRRRLPLGTPVLKVLDSAPKEALLAGRNDYFRAAELCIGSPIGNRLLVDKNPSLTMSVAELARVFPEMKFLMMLRDPRDVVLSCFMLPSLPIRQVNATWLNLGTAVEEYAALMGLWREMAPMLPNPRLEVRYEDMVDDLKTTARRVLDFLGVSWDERVLGFDEHARQKVVRSPTYADVTQKVFRRAMGRWRNYQKYIEPHLSALEPFVKAFGYE